MIDHIYIPTLGRANNQITFDNMPPKVQEITSLCRELDVETGNLYKSRPLEKEADRALEYVYKNI